MWYKVDFNKLAVLLLPTFLRGNVMINYIWSLIKPISGMYDLWYVNRLDNIYKLDHNGQVCYLRKVLNDTFDPIQRRIYIDEGSRFKRKYIYTSAENQPKFLGTMYLQQSSDYEDTGVDFKVIVPSDFNLTTTFYQLKALIDFYKLASKRYVIETK